ncbi:carboxypeptidase regulatory-like domain-containing protein [candidate division KSB1 bacterium]|nr:carboxypeptidase regulatory-like domain-containing protein [candidate division KSB1 bacterium]
MTILPRHFVLLFVTAIITCFCGLGAVTYAAEFSPELDSQLSSRGADDWVSAIVVLESPLDIRALDERLHAEQAPLAKRHREVLEALRYNAATTQPAFLRELEAAKSTGDVIGFTTYWIENLIVVRARPAFLNAWRGRADIRFATENFIPELIEDEVISSGRSRRARRETLDSNETTSGLDAIGATRVFSELGISGEGVLVATVDGGVDVTHPALNSRWRGWSAPLNECWFDALGASPNIPADVQGHGTHVMGTLCGREFLAGDTLTVGVAPNAQWIATNAVGQTGGEELDNDILAAFQWLADPDGNSLTTADVPDVIQNSWGVNGALGYSQCFDFWNSAILNCEAAGPVVVFSAGNDGTSGLRSPATYEISETQMFAVGAVDVEHYPAPYPLASFSSQGPTPCQPNPGAIKPEIVAPGVNVYSSDLFGQYQQRSGTSMAGPHVAGTIALMREACPECDHTTLKQLLMNTALDDGYGAMGPDNQFGAGFLDAYAAVVATLGYGRVQGYVRTAFGQPIAGALVRNPAGTENSYSQTAGDYSIALPPGDYALEFSHFGFETLTGPSVNVVSGLTTDLDVTLVGLPTFLVFGTVTCYEYPAAGAIVEVMNQAAVRDTTDSLGQYQLQLPAGVYDFRAWAAGCDTMLLANVPLGGGSLPLDFPLQHDPQYSCSAADTAGYSVCEDGDFGGPIFSWLEISPMAGGPGTPTGLVGDDQAFGFALPFTFRIYGQDFETVYISTNGILSFDSSSILHNNRPLPVADLGHACVVYWDDFYPLSGGGDISYYYFSAANAFIVEWYNLEHFPGGPPRETFQVWLYNVATNPGPNGDSQVRYQYATVDAASSTTIGLQNGTTLANQYSHLGELQVNAQGVRSGRVLTFGGFQPIGGTIQGIVQDCFGAAADSAIVVFPGSSFGPVTCDAFGFYSIGLSPDIYQVRALKPPCSSALVSDVPVNSAQTVTVNLILNPPPVIQGMVTDCQGGPAAFASVTLPGTEYPVAITDTLGFYSFSVATGVYVVRADNAFCSFALSDTTVLDDGQTTTINLSLEAPPRIQGQVWHCAGGPAVSAVVSLPGFGYMDVATDSSGAYAFTVANGSYLVRADNPICSPTQSADFSIQDRDTITIDLTLAPPPALAGTVTDCFGMPAAYATVTFPGSEFFGVIADSLGQWQVEVLPDTYRVKADNDACSSVLSGDVVAVDGDTAVVNLILRPPPAIAGFVNDCRGGPATGCSVAISGTLASSASTDANGYFFLPVTDDTFTIAADNAWCSVSQLEGVIAFDNDTTLVGITLRNPAGIGGAILDCAGGPAANAAVEIVADSTVYALTDSAGLFYAALYPGRYVVTADNAVCSRITSDTLLLQDGDSLRVDLTLAPPPRIQGTISLCTGGPAANATVSLMDTSLPVIMTNVAGFYFFEVLPDSYAVVAENTTCSAVEAAAVYVADGSTTTVDLVLEPAATIDGYVLGCDGLPADGANVDLNTSPPRNLLTDYAGYFSFAQIPAGNYRVFAQMAGCRPDSVAGLLVSPGQTLSTQITLVVDSGYQCYTPGLPGYEVCEDVDPEGPVFNWRAITPAEGGAGTLVAGLTDDNYAGPIPLPFAFKLYGTSHTQCYVGSNGVVSFGSGVSFAYDNCLPQPALAAGLYACWDDLDPTVGSPQVATRYDATEHVFVIEYYRVSRCCDSTAPRTFEIVLFDEAVYPTATGDNDILFQYNSPLSFPESITAGIQNAGGAQSFTHLCTGVPGSRAAGIAPGRAIRFSTGPGFADVDISVSPLDISQAVPLGGAANQVVQVCNLGSATPLTWTLNFYQHEPPVVLTIPVHEPIREAERGSRTIDNQGGPDGGGYSWKDSNEPDGPVYHWVELRNRGVNTGLHDNNAYVSVPLPWPFPLYNDVFTTAYISTNGNVHFANASTEALNRPLPTAASPNALLAVFWDDLSDSTFGRIWYLNDSLNNRFIVEWDSIGRDRQAGAYTFECMLYRNGQIVYQYKSLAGSVTSASIGIEDRFGTTGTQIAHNQAYVTANLAIRLATFAQWLRIPGSNSGTLQPGQCVDVALDFRAGTLPANVYTGEAVVESNDPDENPIVIPIEFAVGALPVPDRLTISREAATGQISLRWQSTTAPYYRVFSAAMPDGPFDTIEGTTTSTTMTLPDPGAAIRFYIVVSRDQP